MRDGFLGRGLARGTGNANHGLRPKPPHTRRQCLQGDQRILDRNQPGLRGVTRALIVTDNGGYGTSL